eukprot:gb/GFBE01079856.1/.p1 GENE.gb/GFBE01079856.1/~~gb/GFBE01079856.1/.p1  ORF type:complete len:725 (+),score=180.31 gb/GFBE01079856.1/:1-2175(+)
MAAKTFVCLGGYPDIKRSLLERGWEDVSGAGGAAEATLTWTCRTGDVDFSKLETPRLANHFQRISQLCTKVGLNSRLQESRGLCENDIDVFYPQTFHLVGHGEIDAFVNEYRLRKVEGVLKEWLQHVKAGRAPNETFHEDVVRIALEAARRNLANIDELLEEDENEAGVEGFSLSASEWSVLKEVDVDCPNKDIKELEVQKQSRLEQDRNRQQLKQAFAKQVTDLKRMATQLQEKAAKKQQEKLRKQALRQKLSNAVLRSRLPALTGTPSSPGAGTEPSGDAKKEEGTPRDSPGADTVSRRRFSPKGAFATPAAPPGPAEQEEEFTGPSGAELRAEVEKVMDAWQELCPQFRVNGSHNLWILKPAGRARGVGIFLSSNLDEILQTARTERETTTWICQKYVETPLLLDGRKHDLRQWVLITSWDPLTVWFWGECYVRIAADEYVLDDTNNMRHLTNNAVASNHPLFDKEDDHWRCMWDQAQYQDYLRKKFGHDAWKQKVRPAMQRAVLATLTSVQETMLESKAAASCFELVGYDFLVDAELGVWLLEVNTSPSMEYSTCITKRLVPEVLEDSLKVVLGDGPEDAPYGRFELLHRGARIHDASSAGPSYKAATAGLSVEGQRLRPPAPQSSVPGAKEIRESSQRLAERRAQELQALEKKKQQRKEKERQKVEQKQRLRSSLRNKVLGMKNRASSEAAPKANAEGGSEDQNQVQVAQPECSEDAGK